MGSYIPRRSARSAMSRKTDPCDAAAASSGAVLVSEQGPMSTSALPEGSLAAGRGFRLPKDGKAFANHKT